MTRIAPHLALTISLAAACSGGDGTSRDAAVDVFATDAPNQAPQLTSFVPSPTSVAAGVPTLITWNWTYQVEPPIPAAVCTINNGVGEVVRGAMTMVTLTETTVFRLSCSNAVGMTARDTVITIPPAAPTLATFTTTPASVAPNTPTNVTFAWTYTGTPSPVPTCTVDAGIGAIASGTAQSLNLPQARTYRVRCTNSQGTSFRDVTVPVTECGTASAQCNVNATCTETPESYTCACNNGYTGDGDVCNAAVGATTSCDPNATPSGAGPYTCTCNAGYVGPGTTCTKQKIMFTTSVQGNGNLSTWADANSMTGLAAADAVCAARGAALTAAGAGTFVAWMSSDTDDAYCRVHGFGGKKSAMCGQGALPVAAGPWIRPPLSTAAGRPVAPTIDRLVAPTLATYYSMGFNEAGTELALADRVFTGTDENGVATTNNCSNWTNFTSGFRGSAGLAHGGGTSWTHDTSLANDPLCDTATLRLRCVERLAGPALPPRHPTTVKRAFLTSVSGTGNLLSWADATGAVYGSYSSPNAADEICKSRARYAGYANASVFKAFLAGYGYNLSNRVFNTLTSNYTRPDGVILGTSRADLLDSKLAAAWYQTETGAYVAGNTETGAVWTGMSATGTYNASGTCYPSTTTSWSMANTSYAGQLGRYDLLDNRYLSTTTQTCDLTARLYCVEDQ